jgi:hypothetical protein
VSLSRTERQTLDEAERSDHPSDEDKVWLFADAAVGEQVWLHPGDQYAGDEFFS